MKLLTALAVGLLACTTPGTSVPGATAGNLEFLGLTQTIGDRIEIMFRSDNLGAVKSGDTLEVIGVSARHLFVAGEVRSDSIEDGNFIGGDYEENGKSLTYFNRRLKAHYVSTVPVNDLQLAVETAEFYQRSRYFVCTKFNRKVKSVEWHSRTLDTLSFGNTTYDFQNGEFKTSDGTSYPLETYLRLRIKTNEMNDLVVIDDERKTERYIRVFLNNQQVAEILVSLGSN